MQLEASPHGLFVSEAVKYRWTLPSGRTSGDGFVALWGHTVRSALYCIGSGLFLSPRVHGPPLLGAVDTYTCEPAYAGRCVQYFSLASWVHAAPPQYFPVVGTLHALLALHTRASGGAHPVPQFGAP